VSEAHFSSISTRTALTRRSSASSVGGAHPFAVVLGQGEDSEGFGDVFLKPVGQPGRGVAIAGNQIGQAGFGLGEIIRIPDRFQLLADAFADIGVWCMMDRVAGQMELAALPCRAAEHGAAGGAQAAVVVRDDEFDPAHAAGDEAFEERPPMNLGLRQGHRYAKHAPTLIRAYADSRQDGDIAHDPAMAHLLVPGVDDEILDLAEWAVAARAASSSSSSLAARLT
jgi:hypothetical protein